MGFFDDLPSETQQTPAPAKGGGFFDDMPSEVAAPAGAAPAASQRAAGDYIRAGLAAGKKYTPETVADMYEAFDRQAKGQTAPANTTSIAPENPFERAALGVSRTIAKPVTGLAGMASPSLGMELRHEQASIYGHGGKTADEDTSGTVGEVGGGVVNAPYALTPLGRVISAGGAAGNKRIDIAERRARGEDVSGLDELANVAGSAATDYAFNKLNTGTLNATLGKNLAGQPVKEIAARLALETGFATGIGYARQGTDNAVNRVTSDPNQKLLEGMNAQLGVTSGLQGLLMAGLTTRPTNRGLHELVNPANPAHVLDPTVVTSDGTLSPHTIDPSGPSPDSAVLPGQEHAVVDQQGQADVAALNERLAAFEPEPNVPKTPEQLAQEQAAKLADDHADAAFKQADFLPPDQISPEDAAIGKGFEDRAANADLTDRRVTQTPIDPATERRFDEATKGATFETPEQAGANPFFANMKGQSNGQAQTAGNPAPVPHPPQPVAPAAQPAAPQPAPAPAPTPAQPAGPSAVAPYKWAPAVPKQFSNPLFNALKKGYDKTTSGLRARGNLPEVVDAFNTERKGTVDAMTNEGRNDITDWKAAVKKDYGVDASKLDPAQSDSMYKALQGDAAAMGTLKPETQKAIQQMRDRIDTNTQKTLDTDTVSDIGLRTTLSGNKGQYVQRKYRVHSDPNFKPDAAAYDTAVQKLQQPRMNKAGTKQLGPGLSSEQAAARVESMLSDWKEAGDAGGSKGLGAKDLSTLIARDNIDPWVRDLMGEEKSPVTAFAKTVTSQAEMLASHQFLEKTKAAGFGDGWMFDDKSAPVGFTSRIAVPSDSSFAPLNGKRTTPEIAAAFKDVATSTPVKDQPWVKALLFANRLAKTGATVGSVMTQARNWLGQLAFNTASGHLPVGYGEAAGSVFKDIFKGKSDGMVQAAKKYGVLGDGINEHMLLDQLHKEGIRDINTDKNQALVPKAIRGAKAVVDPFMKMYAAADNVGKVVGWTNEIRRAKAAYPEWSHDQQLAYAAERVRNTYPSYSKLPDIVKKARFTPFGPFAGFWYESIRTYGNNLVYASKDLAQGVKTGNVALQRQGAARMAGSVALAMAGVGAAAASRKVFGVSDEDEENFRKNLPGYYENNNIVFTGKGPGTIKYINLSSVNPYSSMFDAVRAASRPNDVKSKLWEGVQQFFGQVTGEQIADAAFTDLRRNQTQSGSRVYNPEDSWEDQWFDASQHVLKNILYPGSAKRIANKIIPALQGQETSWGEALDPKQEITSELTGLRQDTMNYDTSLGFKVREFSRANRDIHSGFNKEVAKPGVTEPGDVTAAYDKMESQRKARFDQMRGLVEGALKSGLTKQQVGRRLKTEGVSDEIIGQLFAGKYVPFNPAESGLPETKAVKENKSFPVKALMDRYREHARKAKQ